MRLPHRVIRYLDGLTPEEALRVETIAMAPTRGFLGPRPPCLVEVAQPGGWTSYDYIVVGSQYDGLCRCHGTIPTNRAIREYLLARHPIPEEISRDSLLAPVALSVPDI